MGDGPYYESRIHWIRASADPQRVKLRANLRKHERRAELLIAANAARFFRPPYVGHRGWLGVELNAGVDWDELEGIVEDAFASVAPKSLLP